MVLRFVLDCLFPIRSLTGGPVRPGGHPGREGEWLSLSDLKSVCSNPMTLSRAELEAMSLISLDRVTGAATFKDFPLLRRAVHFLKYRRVEEIAFPLSSLLVDAARNLDQDPAPVLCPVPLHWTRLFSRGFNQSELLARHVAAATGWPLLPLLKRTRATGHQVGRKRAERLTALTNAFTYTGPRTVPKSVLLIDDLCTTGTTLEACAGALKKAGVERVEALVLAVVR